MLTILNEKELAKLLSIKPRTLRLWRQTRGLPHFRITSRIIRYMIGRQWRHGWKKETETKDNLWLPKKRYSIPSW